MISDALIVAPAVSEEQAMELFRPRRFKVFAWQVGRYATPETIELIHLPYYFFNVTVSDDYGRQDVRLAVDALLGDTMLFVGSDLQYDPSWIHNGCGFQVTATAAKATAVREYRWLLLEHGLRSRRPMTVSAVSSVREVYYPFWVAYFRRRGAYDFKVMDGVSGAMQGVKMRRVVLQSLRITE